MLSPQIVGILVTLATWAGFTGIMTSYFRHSRRRSTGKTVLLVCGFLCTMAQLVALGMLDYHFGGWFYLGLAGLAVSNVLFWWSLAAHGKQHPAFAFIAVPPETLTTAGPYRLIRHPIYAAYLAAWCSPAALAAQPWLLLAVACMGMIYFTAAWREERAFLTSPLAAPYSQYRQRTGMFVPSITGLLVARRSQVAPLN